MRWQPPSLPALLLILRELAPDAEVQVEMVDGSDIDLTVCHHQHVHCTVGVMAPYAYVLAGVAKAHAVSLYLVTPGLDLRRALDRTWAAVEPALGPTAKQLRAVFFAGPNPEDDLLH